MARRCNEVIVLADQSKIEWTEATWNPVTGCSKVSTGCQHCYAERLAHRLHAMGNPQYVNVFTPTMHEQALSLPMRWKRPRMIFVNSMSDLFHEAVSDEFILSIFNTMVTANQHHYQILTKRSERLFQLNHILPWRKHIGMGVTVESADYLYRLDHLRQTDAQLKFVSIEPMLSPLREIDLTGIDWVIVGGESGPGARPMQTEWVIEIRDKCIAAGVPFFFKQWGGVRKSKNGRLLDGVTWDQMPTW
ncbi:MAG: Phage protein Gp37/Gp68 [bacterium ADurb.Bin429]|nr:MAG: Phage protein Gp37/Gp68 [bacterium ADurb.Bin429]